MYALFEGEELSEEFKTKATTIFEAAVKQVVAEQLKAIQEAYAGTVFPRSNRPSYPICAFVGPQISRVYLKSPDS